MTPPSPSCFASAAAATSPTLGRSRTPRCAGSGRKSARVACSASAGKFHCPVARGFVVAYPALLTLAVADCTYVLLSSAPLLLTRAFADPTLVSLTLSGRCASARSKLAVRIRLAVGGRRRRHEGARLWRRDYRSRTNGAGGPQQAGTMRGSNSGGIAVKCRSVRCVVARSGSATDAY